MADESKRRAIGLFFVVVAAVVFWFLFNTQRSVEFDPPDNWFCQLKYVNYGWPAPAWRTE